MSLDFWSQKSVLRPASVIEKRQKVHIRAFVDGQSAISPSSGGFGRMIFQKKTSMGDRTKFRSTTSAGARGGAGTCDAPSILGRVLDSAFVQVRVRLNYSDGLT